MLPDQARLSYVLLLVQGAHDADWEHVTLRLSPDGSAVQGLYYSAHRWDWEKPVPAGDS
jgi:hypothetical protein